MLRMTECFNVTTRSTTPKRGYTTGEAAIYIGRSVSWLRKKRLRGVDDPGDPGPRYLKTNGGSAIYLREDLDGWLDSLTSSALALRAPRATHYSIA
jgi:hypothetical protein